MIVRPNFRDADHLYRVFDELLKDFFSDPEIGPKIRATKLIVQWSYSDPDALVTFNLRDRPREGYWADWRFGESDWKPDVTTYQTASFGLAFLQGAEKTLPAIARRRIRAKGKINALMKLAPIARPLAKRTRQVLRKMGETQLVIPWEKRHPGRRA